jgi:hypothetical protein
VRFGAECDEAQADVLGRPTVVRLPLDADR